METIEKDYFIGEVSATFFSNPDNYYRVLKIAIDETNTLYSEKSIVVVGTFVSIQEGTTYRFEGDLIEHDRYGLQFKCDHYEAQKITSKEGLIQYLSSDSFPGIGKVLAKRLVALYKEKTIETIVENPEALKEVKGLTAKKIEMLHQKLKEKEDGQAVFIALAEMGFSTQLAAKIYAKYQEQATEIIKENPYVLITDISGFGFQKADQLAIQLGFDLESFVRIKGGLVFTLEQLCFSEGNTTIPRKELIETAQQLLSHQGRSQSIAPDTIEQALSDMSEMGDIIFIDEERVALPSLYYSEVGSVKALEVMQNQRYQPEFTTEAILEELEILENTQGVKYGRAQKQAIIEALQSKLFILTGGPGTGKTTVVNAIVQIFAQLKQLSLNEADYDYGEFPILLAAPTGRAAKRMSELTHLTASTIHRLLGLTGEEDEEEQGGIGAQLEGELLIIDEMSMVDTWLFYQLMESLPPFMQVVFVGDKDQLPSVGPGQVLSDLLRSKRIPSRELDEIFRQSESSTITTLAHNIKQGQIPNDFTQNKKDRSFFQVPTTNMAKIVATIAKRAVDKGYSMQDVQVLSPMYKGEAGITYLNKVLQETLNPMGDTRKREVVHFEQVFRVGDKVLQLKNEAEKNIFNGDIGEVVAIFYANETMSKSDELVVAFDEIEVIYQKNEWNHLTLAYCCSIHKAQGSEFPIVILPLVPQQKRMLQRNLLYTAITRAKQSLIMCGDQQAFQFAIEHETQPRQTLLCELLLDSDLEPYEHEPLLQTSQEEKEDDIPLNSEIEVTSLPEILTNEAIESGIIDPMIGMETLSPYDF